MTIVPIRTALTVLFLTALLGHFSVVRAQQTPTPRVHYGDDHILVPHPRPQVLIGPFGGAMLNRHSGAFVTRESGLVCCEFTEGSAAAGAFGVRAFVPFGWYAAVSPRLAFEGRGGIFDAELQSYPFFGENDTLENVVFANVLDATIQTVTLDILAVARIPQLGIYVAAGPGVALVAASTFRKTERIADPADVSYLDGTTEKVMFEGDLVPISKALYTVRAGGGLLVRVFKRLYVNPEVLYVHQLNPMYSDPSNEWNAAALQLSFGILYDP